MSISHININRVVAGGGVLVKKALSEVTEKRFLTIFAAIANHYLTF